MRAAVLEKNGISCKDVPYTTAGPNDVVIKVAYCGVCGSDYPRVMNGKAHHYPIILGHEFSGVVHETGSSVRSFKKGDRVVGIPLIPCFKCEACEKGLYSLCSEYKFIGSRIDGAYAEFVCVPEKNLLKIPDNTSLRDAALIEPCTVSRHVFTMVDVKDKKVAVIGSGIIGLFAVQWANIMGSNDVTLVTHGNKELDIEKVGCKKIVSDTELQNIKADIIIDCAGTGESIKNAFKIADMKSIVLLIGTPKKDITFSIGEWEVINRKELSIIGSWMSYSSVFPGVEWKDSLKQIKRMCSNLDSCIKIEYVGLEDTNKIFIDTNNKKKRKFVLVIDSEENDMA